MVHIKLAKALLKRHANLVKTYDMSCQEAMAYILKNDLRMEYSGIAKNLGKSASMEDLQKCRLLVSRAKKKMEAKHGSA